MNRLVRTELLKQRTTPVFLLSFAAVPVLAGLVTLAVLGGAGRQGNAPLGPDSLAQALAAPGAALGVMALLLGVVGMSGEYRHGTITTTFLAAPRRRDVVVAKLLAHAAGGALMVVVATAVTAAIAVPWLVNAGVPLGLDGDLVRATGGVLASTALHAALGVAVAAVLRNQTAAVAAVLVWLLAVEELLGYLLRSAAIVDWLPGALGSTLVQARPGAPSAWLVAGALAAYVGLLAAAGTRYVVRRDVS